MSETRHAKHARPVGEDGVRPLSEAERQALFDEQDATRRALQDSGAGDRLAALQTLRRQREASEAYLLQPSEKSGLRPLLAAGALLAGLGVGTGLFIHHVTESHGQRYAYAAPSPYDYATEASMTPSASASATPSPSALSTSVSPSPTHEVVVHVTTIAPSPKSTPSRIMLTPSPSPIETSPAAQANCYMDFGAIVCSKIVYSHQFASESSPLGPSVANAKPNCSDEVGSMFTVEIPGDGTFWTSGADLGFNPCA